MLKDTPKGGSPITDLKFDESEENEGKAEGAHPQHDCWLARVLALRAPVDTRLNSLHFMTESQ